MHEMSSGMKLIINEMEGLQPACKRRENQVINEYRVSSWVNQNKRITPACRPGRADD